MIKFDHSCRILNFYRVKYYSDQFLSPNSCIHFLCLFPIFAPFHYEFAAVLIAAMLNIASDFCKSFRYFGYKLSLILIFHLDRFKLGFRHRPEDDFCKSFGYFGLTLSIILIFPLVQNKLGFQHKASTEAHFTVWAHPGSSTRLARDRQYSAFKKLACLNWKLKNWKKNWNPNIEI